MLLVQGRECTFWMWKLFAVFYKLKHTSKKCFKKVKLHTTECSSTHLQQTLFCVMTKSFSLAPCTATVSSTRKLFWDHFTDGALLQHDTGKCSNMMNATFWSKKCTAALTGSCFGTTSLMVLCCSMIQEITVTHNECSSLVQEMQGYTHWRLFCDRFIAAALHKKLQ